MVRSNISSVLQYICGLAAADNLGSVPDRQLLQRFIGLHEEAAFATLLQRHGPMVLGVCRRVLRQTQDAAEDAFQATCLLLARGASGIRNPDAVGGWLHGIAASNSTAVDIRPDGSAMIVATPDAPVPWAYFVTAPNTDPQIGNNQPLSWQGISVIRVAVGGTFNLGTWTADAAGKKFMINVNKGLLSVEGNNDYY